MVIGAADGLPWSPILIQTRDPLLSNVKLRRALAHAIDGNQIAEAETNGLSKGNPSAVSRSSAYFDEAFLDWPAYDPAKAAALAKEAGYRGEQRSEEHTYELQSLMRISYAVFCLKKKKQ